MSGFYESEFCIGSLDLILDEVRDDQGSASFGLEYVGEIASSEKIGNITNVTLR